jgi:hypothetical protein
MTHWKPIETAPKNGARVLCCQPGDKNPYIAEFGDDQWWTDEDRYNPNEYAPPTCQPMHWMPLPNPPEGE